MTMKNTLLSATASIFILPILSGCPTGYSIPDYGGTANLCIDNAAEALHRIDGGKRDAHLLHYKPKSAFRIKSHAQGVARLPGLGDENWFAVSRKARHLNEIIEFVHFDQILSDGGPLATARTKNGSHGKNVLSFDPPEHTNNHAGGIQAVVRYLFVGSDGDSSRVDAYDVSNVPYGGNPRHVTQLIIGKRGEPKGDSPAAHWVAAARLEDGRYVLAVGKDERDLAKTNKPHHAWFYISKNPSLEDTDWFYWGFWDYSRVQGRGAHQKAYQSVNAITECNGNVYLAMMRPGRAKKNYIDLWHLGINEDLSPRLVKVTQKRIFKRRRKGRCTFNAGGGIHITPDGKDLVIYCTGKKGRKDMQIDEYRDK